MLEFHNVPLKTILRRAIMSLPTNFNDILRLFEKDYDTAKEDNALSARGQFLQLYPLNRLKKMTYVSRFSIKKILFRFTR